MALFKKKTAGPGKLKQWFRKVFKNPGKKHNPSGGSSFKIRQY